MVGFPWTFKYMIILPQVLSLVGYNLLSISAQIILDVPTVGGRLMLVDMAGSENIEQAGQIGFEAKMQVMSWWCLICADTVCSTFNVIVSNVKLCYIEFTDCEDQPRKHSS